MKEKRILVLMLTAFSHMGGIEKFNRAFIKALMDLSAPLSLRNSFAGMHDNIVDVRYTEAAPYRFYNGHKIKFVIASVWQAFQQDVIILGHLNLAMIGVLMKLFAPQKKLIVICHGIEVFSPVGGWKKKVLHLADHILAVSTFTKQQLISQQKLLEEKITVFPNTIDPFFQLPSQFSKPAYLLQRYGIAADEKVIFTLTRLNSEEGYKGYDTLVNSLQLLVKKNIPFKYILAGKADATELHRMNLLIKELDLQDHVIMPGFLPNEEITDHYLLADVFAMPSKGEGFGIVYIEAMACGLQVIAGNKDGSTEALQFGKLGTLVDPDNEAALAEALVKVLGEVSEPLEVQQKMLQHFSFEKFKGRLKIVLQS